MMLTMCWEATNVPTNDVDDVSGSLNDVNDVSGSLKKRYRDICQTGDDAHLLISL